MLVFEEEIMTTEFEENLRNEVENETKEKDPPTNDRELEKGIQDLQIYKENTIDDFRFEDHDPDRDNNNPSFMLANARRLLRELEDDYLLFGKKPEDDERYHHIMETIRNMSNLVPENPETTNSDFDGDYTEGMEPEFDRVSKISKATREKINRSKPDDESFEKSSNTRFSEEHSMPRETMETEFEKGLENEPNEDVSPPDTKIEKQVKDLQEFEKICNSAEQFIASLEKLIEYKQNLGSMTPINLLSFPDLDNNFGMIQDTTREILIASGMSNVLLQNEEYTKGMSDEEKAEYFFREQHNFSFPVSTFFLSRG